MQESEIKALVDDLVREKIEKSIAPLSSYIAGLQVCLGHMVQYLDKQQVIESDGFVRTLEQLMRAAKREMTTETTVALQNTINYLEPKDATNDHPTLRLVD